MNRRAQRVRRCHRDEAGVTLTELIVAVSILGIVGAVLAGAFIVSARTNAETKTRYDESHDAQIASAYLATDVQSSDTTNCSGGSNLVTFTYSDGSVASYTYGSGTVSRAFTSGGSTTTTPLVHFAGSSAPTVTCTGGTTDKPNKVKIGITEASGYSYSLAGARRIHTAAGSVSSPGAVPPLLALGNGGVNIGLNGSHAPLHVGGDIIVNSNSSSAVTVNNNNVGDGFTYTGTLYIFTGGDCTAPSCTHVTRNTRVPDPLAGLPAPPTSGANVYVHNSPFTPSGTLAPGIYILTAGLSMSGNDAATGDGVMFYVTGGSVNLSGNASLSLTPPSISPYNDLGDGRGIVLWQASSNTAAMSIGGNGGAASFHGLVYAPSAAVTLNGNGNIYIASVIASSVSVSGGGSDGNVCINLPANACA